MKATNNAWYWLAAGVLALGLNGYFQDGGLPVLHRLAACARSRVAEARVQYGQMATLAQVAMADHARLRRDRAVPVAAVAVSVSLPSQAQARLAELQTRLETVEAAHVQARVQQVMSRREMRRAQVEMRNGRIQVMTDQGQVQMALPSLPHMEIVVPQAPFMDLTDSN